MGQNGIFYLSKRETNGSGILPDLSVVFGSGGDVPLAGRWRQEAAYCELPTTNFGDIVRVHRAPIEGNPAEILLQVTSSTLLQINGYARDAVDNTLWLRINQNEVNGKNLSTIKWVQVGVADPDNNPQTPITVVIGSDPVPFYLLDKDKLENINRFAFKVNLGTLNTCINANTLGADLTSTYPVASIPSLPWRSSATPPSFTYLPVSIQPLCDALVDGVQQREIHGFGYHEGSVSYPPPQKHMGVDFFVPIGSKVYSVSDNGIVVGIGLQRTDGDTQPKHSSGQSWGAFNTNAGDGKNLIVRYKDFYVLYGHLNQIDPNIYVGKTVSAGEFLGTLGALSNPHLHIEVRSFGANIVNGSVALNTNNQFNVYGILQLETTQAIHVYDIAQFYAETGVVGYRNDLTSELITVNGMGKAIQRDASIVTSVCDLTYKLGTDNSDFKIVNGYRGFQLAVENVTAPHDPNIPTTPPVGAPVEP